MMMSFTRSSTTFLVILVIFVIIIGQVHVEGARMLLSEEFKSATDLTTSSYVYEKAKFTMAYWLERLASGPSPKGPGH